MSITKSITVHCDVCAQWFDFFSQSVLDARTNAKKAGWRCDKHGDLCPQCRDNRSVPGDTP